MNGLSSPVLAVAVLLLVAAAGTALDTLLPAPSSGPEVAADERPAVSGAWYCAAGRSDAENQLSGAIATGPAVPSASALRLDVVADGEVHRGEELEVAPGSLHLQPVEPRDADLAIAARWWDTPAAVGRVWRRSVTGEPSGILEGGCEPEAADTWYLPGVSTAGGAQGRIVVANPFDTDAALGVSLYTDAGVDTPELLKNLSVPARTVRVIELNEHAPEIEDLGAVVVARAGRVVVEGWQSVDPAVGGIEGVTLAKLATAPADAWTVPWLGDEETWAWVLNPSERAAALEVTVHTPEGGSPLSDLSEASVPPGSVQRIDLAEVLPEGVGQGALTVASANGVPIVVSTGTVVRSDDVARTGVAVQLGQTAPDAGWTIVTGSNDGRGEALHLVNPTSSPAVVDVTVADPGGAHSPETAQDLTVPPGTALDVDLRGVLPALDVHAVFVTADEGAVVAGIRTFGWSGALDLVAHAGVPSRAWRAAEDVPPVQLEPGLTTRLGTRLGPALSPPPTPDDASPTPDGPAPATAPTGPPATEPPPEPSPAPS